MFTRESFTITARSLSGRDTFSNILNETRSFSQEEADTTIFLSHSHVDIEYVKMARAFFEKFGVKIWVDWADDSMPKKTCGETACIIKSKIRSNHFFIYLATDTALESMWCNWEIGYADHWKNPKNMAIIPISDNRDTWKGNEYLQLYPEIVLLNEASPSLASSYYIKFPNGNQLPLKEWLNKK